MNIFNDDIINIILSNCIDLQTLKNIKFISKHISHQYNLMLNINANNIYNRLANVYNINNSNKNKCINNISQFVVEYKQQLNTIFNEI
jgi:hypothetical protein